MLSAEDIKAYNENGYVVLHDFFDRDVIRELSQVCNALCAGARDLTQNTELYDLEESHRPDDVRVRRLKRPTEMDPAFHRMARDPRLLDAISDLIGPAIRLTHPKGKVNIKAAGYGSAVEWHQDWAAYPHTNDDLLAIGIPLDDCLDDNAPMMVIPDSHKGPVHDHHVGGYYSSGIDPETSGIDFSTAVPLTGRAGMVTFHHVRTVHGSALNRSDRPRRLFILQYAAADAWPLLGISDFAQFNEAIVRGAPVQAPRMEALPVRIPLPLPETQGSIYEQQLNMSKRYFERYDDQSATPAV